MAKSKHTIVSAGTSLCQTPSADAASNQAEKEDEFVSDIAHDAPTFFTLYGEGRVTAEQVDDYVEAWHESGDEETRSLCEYLGLTEEECDGWVMTPRALPVILEARRANAPLRDFVEQFNESLRARGDPKDASVLYAMSYWLKDHPPA